MMNRRLTAGLLIATMLATQTPTFATNVNETIENEPSDSIEVENINSEEANSETPIEEIVEQTLNEIEETTEPESKLDEQSLNESPIVGHAQEDIELTFDTTIDLFDNLLTLQNMI